MNEKNKKCYDLFEKGKSYEEIGDILDLSPKTVSSYISVYRRKKNLISELRKRYTIEDLRIYAKKQGGFCLSTKYINSHTKYIWKCAKGHIWSAKWTSIHVEHTWCNECYLIEKRKHLYRTKAKKHIKQMKKIMKNAKDLSKKDLYLYRLNAVIEKLTKTFDFELLPDLQLTLYVLEQILTQLFYRDVQDKVILAVSIYFTSDLSQEEICEKMKITAVSLRSIRDSLPEKDQKRLNHHQYFFDLKKSK